MAEQADVPKVTAKASPNSLGQTLSAKDELFQLSRPTAGDQDLTVRYSLTEYDSTGENTYAGVSVISAGSTQSSIFAGPELAGRQPQVLTVAVQDQPGYQSATPIATRLLTPADGRIADTVLFAAYRQSGSQEAFAALVQQHRASVMRTCQRIVGNWADAEDVSQFVFLALTQLQVRPSISLGGWLHKVSRNASISFLRSKSRRDRHEFAAAKPSGNDSDEATRSLRESLDVAIEKLPVSVRQAVQLRYIEGWSQQEAAQIVGIPRGTLSQRASQGIHLLRKLLKSDRAATG
jgi:RNA polymerase sigma-70 factor (ECF subfamily)